MPQPNLSEQKSPTSRVFVFAFLVGVFFQINIQAQGSKTENLPPLNYRWDLIVDNHYSKYNFTDRVTPYKGIDSWMEFKLSNWLDKREKWAIYTSVLGSNMFFTAPEAGVAPFHWQNYLQNNIGLQFYPFFEKGAEYTPFFGLRFFLFGGLRWYYDQKESENPFTNYQTKDFQAGFDYYYDRPVFNDEKRWVFIAWTNATFRATNFSLDKYNSLFLTGNLKAGYKIIKKNPIILVHGLTDWTYVVSPCKCRWWENYLRWGGGLRIYPFTSEGNTPWNVILRRFQIYGEYLNNFWWIKNDPNDKIEYENLKNEVNRHDWRIGIGFSTSGFFRSND